jgi:hypothetical protein
MYRSPTALPLPSRATTSVNGSLDMAAVLRRGRSLQSATTTAAAAVS